MPNWATDCLKRAEPALRSDAPLVLYEKLKGAMRLVELDRSAWAAGLFVGQSLSDARALVPSLRVREIDRRVLTESFADFADWHSYASPLVAVLADKNAYGDLVLDITGVSHLFGGEAQMLEKLVSRLDRLGLMAQGAIAASVGAAWALAHFAPGTVLEGDPAATLESLPVAGLRLAEEQVSGLSILGLKTIGDLYGRNRKTLQARFGSSLLLRLDQALGRIAERPTPRLPKLDFYADRRFAEPLGLIDDVLMTAHDLAIRLSSDLERAGRGAQEFHLFLYRVDHKVTSLVVRAGRATRDAAHIGRLFAHRAERLGAEYDAGFGIDMIRLAAAVTSPLEAAQSGIFAAPEGTADLDRLYDRMASRLGPAVIFRLKFVDTHIPERAMMLESTVARTPDNPRAAPDPTLPRPLRLLPRPEPIEALLAEVPDGPPRGMIWRRVRYRFQKALGPERIAPEWWRDAEIVASTRKVSSHKPERSSRDDPAPGRARPAASGLPSAEIAPPSAAAHQPSLFAAEAVTRDYFIVEDDGGRRFWLFREGLYEAAIVPRWFLHGFFA